MVAKWPWAWSYLDASIYSQDPSGWFFLGEGEGYAAQNYKTDQTMQETIQNLRDGWYGNIIAPIPGVEAPAITWGNFGVVWSPAKCAKHIEHSIKEYNKRILWCGGIGETMLGGVTILPWYIADTAVLIDAIIDLIQTDHHNPNEDDTGQTESVPPSLPTAPSGPGTASL